MASELPDALDKLSLQESLTANSSATSLSKYFGRANNTHDIFDTIVKPRGEEHRVDFFRNNPTDLPSSVDENNVIISPSKSAAGPSVSFQKCEDEEPKIFSYFAHSLANTKDASGSEFFDQISQQISKTREPMSISTQGSILEQQYRISSSVTVPPITTDSPDVEDSKEICVTSVLSPNILNSYSPLPTASTGHDAGTLCSPSPSNSFSLSSIPNIPFTSLSTKQEINSAENFTYLNKVRNKSQEMLSSSWIPGEETQKYLDLCSVSNSNFKGEGIKLTSPGLSNSVELTDPIQDLVRHFDGEVAASNRQTLTADLVTQDDKGIQELIQAGCWRAAINLSGRLLTAYGQGYGKIGHVTKHTPHSLQLWFTRLALLVKAQLIDVAVAEMIPFGDLDSPDLFYQYYPELYGNKSGSMVPFAFRLLAAELPAYSNKISEAQEKLCRLLVIVRQIIRRLDKLMNADSSPTDKEDALSLWVDRETRVVHSLVNCALMKKDYHNTLQLLHQLLKRSDQHNPTLFSVLGRVYLQLGDVVRAQRAFNTASDLRDNSQPSNAVASLADAAVVAVAQNAFAEAYGYYQQALSHEPENPMLVNNAAVCLLYLGRMKESMMMLEESLGTKPNLMLHNPTVLNVCTLYELESSLTTQRKLGMLRLASQWRSDNLNSSSFKLQS